MAKKGINIKQLARELGVTSRQVLDRCREAGVTVQNSVTKLSADRERTIRQWYEPSVQAETDSSRDA